MRVGVLSIQGGVAEHLNHINALGHSGILVKSTADLDNIERLIIPGGESTTICKILKEEGIFEVLKDKIKNGLKVWGTCAGMIILSNEVRDFTEETLGCINVKVKRNAFGRQLGSYEEVVDIEALDIEKFKIVFIRAPIIEEVDGDVNIILKSRGNIVAASEGNVLVTSFHPELTSDFRFHKYFIENF